MFAPISATLSPVARGGLGDVDAGRVSYVAPSAELGCRYGPDADGIVARAIFDLLARSGELRALG